VHINHKDGKGKVMLWQIILSCSGIHHLSHPFEVRTLLQSFICFEAGVFENNYLK